MTHYRLNQEDERLEDFNGEEEDAGGGRKKDT